ncbi:MAG: hypothetical protein WDW38_010750 [Sanguina aurantia]
MSQELKAVFYTFCGQGMGASKAAETTDIDSAKFAKLCKDAGLVDKGFTVTDCDLIFTKCKTKGARKLVVTEFVKACDEIAARKKITPGEVHAKVIAASPSSSGTQAEAVKFHDDKSLYTGVYAKGGPTNVDKLAAGGLGGLLDRSPADVRGVKK